MVVQHCDDNQRPEKVVLGEVGARSNMGGKDYDDWPWFLKLSHSLKLRKWLGGEWDVRVHLKSS